MKIIVLALICLLSLFVDTSIFPNISIIGIAPDFTLCVTVSFALLAGSFNGAMMGLACGLLIDIMCGSSLGFYAMQYVIVGFLAGIPSQKLRRNRIFAPAIAAGIGYMIKTVILCVLLLLRRSGTNILLVLAKSLLGALVTAILMLLVHFLNRKLHSTRMMRQKLFQEKELDY